MRLPRLAPLAALLVLAGCAKTPAPPSAPPAAPLTVTSPDFGDGATIPAGFTCTDGGRRPGLSWTGGSAPAWAIVVDDPDAPGGDFYHWIVVDLPGGTTGVGDALPAGAVELKNSGGSTGWTAPCPPSGTHHYRFTVYALSGPTGVASGTSLDQAFNKITKAATAQGRLTGLVTHGT